MPVARSRQSLAVGIVAAVLVAASGAPEVAALVGWIVAAAGLLVQVWRVSWPADHDETKGLAEEKGQTYATDTAVLIAAVAGLAAVVEALARSGTQDAIGIASVVLGVVVVILSWAVVLVTNLGQS